MHTAAVMTREVVVVTAAVTVGGAARMMERLRIRHLPVVEAGRLVGILSDRDLPKHDQARSCAEAMTPAPMTCAPDAPISRVARLMLDHKVDSIPIVDPAGRLVGLVTSTDLLWLLADREEALKLPFAFNLQLARTDHDAQALAA